MSVGARLDRKARSPIGRCVCSRCLHAWEPIGANLPKICPKCKSRLWNIMPRPEEILRLMKRRMLERRLEPVKMRNYALGQKLLALAEKRLER